MKIIWILLRLDGQCHANYMTCFFKTEYKIRRLQIEWTNKKIWYVWLNVKLPFRSKNMWSAGSLQQISKNMYTTWPKMTLTQTMFWSMFFHNILKDRSRLSLLRDLMLMLGYSTSNKLWSWVISQFDLHLRYFEVYCWNSTTINL